MIRDIWQEKKLFFTVSLLLLINTAATLAPAEGGQQLVKLLEKGAFGKILPIILILLGIVIIKVGSDFLRQFFTGYLGQKISSNTLREVHDKFLHLPPSWFKNQDSGELLSRTTNDIQEVRYFLSTHLPDFVKNPLIIIVGLTALFIKNWIFTLELLSVGFLIILATQLIGSRIRTTATKVRESLGSITSSLQRSLFSIDIIKIFTREKFHRKKFNQELNNYLDHSKKEIALSSIIRPINELLSSLATIAIIGTGIWLISKGQMKSSELVGFILYLAVLSSPLNALSYITVQYKKATASASRINEILTAQNENNRNNLPDLPTINGKICFKNIHFSYRKEEPILRGINFSIAAGTTTAIVGSSGCGKTTLINLIPALIIPNKGTIKIDNKNITHVNLPSLRRQIGVVTQESILFNGTILENIRYGNLDSPDNDVIKAAQKANAHTFIKKFKDEYNTIIGDRGILLSGGQRQRLAIARVILQNPRILILDEATSSLDNENERAIQEAITRISKNLTTFVIAHRLSTIQHANKILVINNGQIIQEGTHKELLRKNGLYKKLYTMQFTNDL